MIFHPLAILFKRVEPIAKLKLINPVDREHICVSRKVDALQRGHTLRNLEENWMFDVGMSRRMVGNPDTPHS